MDIGWQDIRTSATVDNLSESAGKLGSSTFKRVCGLNISTYFTTVKLHWLLHNVPAVKKYYDDDELMFGTIDTWLLYVSTLRLANDELFLTLLISASPAELRGVCT